MKSDCKIILRFNWRYKNVWKKKDKDYRIYAIILSKLGKFHEEMKLFYLFITKIIASMVCLMIERFIITTILMWLHAFV